MITIEKEIKTIQKNSKTEIDIITVTVTLFNCLTIFKKTTTEEFDIDSKKSAEKSAPIGFKDRSYVDRVYIDEDDL